MNSRVTGTTIPRLSTRFRFQFEAAQNAWVLLYPEGMITLNGSAGAILKRVDASRNVSELIDAVQAEFPGAELESDIVQFLEQAHARGWITLD